VGVGGGGAGEVVNGPQVPPPPPLRPAVFLDRDGTLNRQVIRDGRPYPPATVDEFTLFEGVDLGCRDLRRAGFALIVVTNQPDVGRGDQDSAVVEAMHARLQALVPEIDRIEVCYAPGQGRDHPENRRRKPEPGMIVDAAAALGLDLTLSWMVGDRWRDIDCGKKAGLRTVFIDFGYDETLRERPDVVVRSFPEAVQAILSHPQPTATSPLPS
jgi:D-glycero-D-manno-heptose 1,7-bisphosphate phosphatase